jgi:hypothetical protein
LGLAEGAGFDMAAVSVEVVFRLWRRRRRDRPGEDFDVMVADGDFGTEEVLRESVVDNEFVKDVEEWLRCEVI